jgi:hypothetical protein
MPETTAARQIGITVRGEPRVRHSSSLSDQHGCPVTCAGSLVAAGDARSVLDAGGRVLHARAAAVLTVAGFVLSTV